MPNETETGNPATHFYCESCGEIRTVIFEILKPIVSIKPGKWLGGDIVCEECKLVIATAYRWRE